MGPRPDRPAPAAAPDAEPAPEPPASATGPAPEPSGEPGTDPSSSVDSDVDLHVPAQRRELGIGHGDVLAVVALGGALGATARYAATLLWPVPDGVFPWTTLCVNVLGCAVIGVFMVLIAEVWAAHRLVRPFFGTGVLGGFTTFSTYAVDIQHLLELHRTRAAFGYLALTLLAALAGVWSAVWLTRRVLAWRR